MKACVKEATETTGRLDVWHLKGGSRSCWYRVSPLYIYLLRQLFSDANAYGTFLGYKLAAHISFIRNLTKVVGKDA